MGIESRVKQLLRRSYRFAWSYDLWRYGRPSRHQGRPLVVYQMGKVGSTSVYRALQAAAPEYSVYHVHTLDAEQMASAQRSYARTYHLRGVVPHHLMASRHLRSDLERGQPRGRWKVLTLVRDPIARNVSSFFQDLQLRHPDFPYASRLASGDTERLAADLVELFLSRHDHDEPLRWCDRELRGVLGVDVYAAPFPHDRGWACCEDLAPRCSSSGWKTSTPRAGPGAGRLPGQPRIDASQGQRRHGQELRRPVPGVQTPAAPAAGLHRADVRLTLRPPLLQPRRAGGICVALAARRYPIGIPGGAAAGPALQARRRSVTARRSWRGCAAAAP